MKKNQLKLSELKITSFTTEINRTDSRTIEGGATPTTVYVTGHAVAKSIQNQWCRKIGEKAVVAAAGAIAESWENCTDGDICNSNYVICTNNCSGYWICP